MGRFLFVSDLHVNDENYERTLEGLNNIVSKYDVDFIVSGGDNGEVDNNFLDSLNACFYSIYGNHDTIEWVKDFNGHWLHDGMHVIGDFSLLAWNGIFGFSEKYPKWYHRSLDDFIRFGYSWANARPDVFVSHEIPYYNRFGKQVQEYLSVMNYGVKMIKPRVWLNGHIHRGVIIDRDTFQGIVYVNVESKGKKVSGVIVEKDGDEINITIVEG